MRKQKIDIEALTENIKIELGMTEPAYRHLPREEKAKRQKRAEEAKRQIAAIYLKRAEEEEAERRKQEKTPIEKRAKEAYRRYKEAPKGDKSRRKWKNYAITCALRAIDEGKADKMPPHLVNAAEKARQPRAERAAKIKAYGPTLYRVSEYDEANGLIAYKDKNKRARAERTKASREKQGRAYRVRVSEIEPETEALAIAEALALLKETEATNARRKHYKLAEPRYLKEAAELWRAYVSKGGKHQPTAKIAEQLEREAER